MLDYAADLNYVTHVWEISLKLSFGALQQVKHCEPGCVTVASYQKYELPFCLLVPNAGIPSQ